MVPAVAEGAVLEERNRGEGWIMAAGRVRTSWWVLLLLGVLCVFPVMTAAVSQASDAAPDPVNACWASELPAGVDPHDDTLRTVDITAIPAGRHCDWERGDTQTGWPVTIAALIASAACLVITAFALGQGGWSRRLVALLPLLAIAVSWLVIWSSTMYVIID